MTRIDFITSYQSAGAQVAYPLIKWRKLLRQNALDVRIRHSFCINKSSPRSDVVILTHPFYRDQFPLIRSYDELHQKIDLHLAKDLAFARNHYEKVIFFDTGDATASFYLHFLDHVDVLLKQQLLLDRSYYCSEAHEKKGCIWIESEQPFRHRAEPHGLHKLAVGWNLAYFNHSLLRKGSRHLIWRGITWDPVFTSVARDRPILSSFRAGFSGSRGGHREKAVQALGDMRRNDVILGPPINRWGYLREIKRSKAVVSPFGYGEPCYRDMEAFIHGAILVKPSMDHLVTFPNVYRPHETYVPVRWDFEDLPSTLIEIQSHYEDYREIAHQGQAVFRDYYENGQYFVDHIRRLIE